MKGFGGVGYLRADNGRWECIEELYMYIRRRKSISSAGGEGVGLEQSSELQRIFFFFFSDFFHALFLFSRSDKGDFQRDWFDNKVKSLWWCNITCDKRQPTIEE